MLKAHTGTNVGPATTPPHPQGGPLGQRTLQHLTEQRASYPARPCAVGNLF